MNACLHHIPTNDPLKVSIFGQKTRLNRPVAELSGCISRKFLNCPTKIGPNHSILMFRSQGIYIWAKKWKLDERYLPWSVIEFLLRYVERYGIIMHTSYLPTGQRSRLKETIQMQISSDIKPQEAAWQPVLPGGRLRFRPRSSREPRVGTSERKRRDRAGKHYPITVHIS